MDKFILLNDEEFLVVRELDVDNVHYIYVISTTTDKYTLLVETDNNGTKMVKSVTDRDELKKVMELIAKENN